MIDSITCGDAITTRRTLRDVVSLRITKCLSICSIEIYTPKGKGREQNSFRLVDSNLICFCAFAFHSMFLVQSTQFAVRFARFAWPRGPSSFTVYRTGTRHAPRLAARCYAAGRDGSGTSVDVETFACHAIYLHDSSIHLERAETPTTYGEEYMC